MEGCIRGAVRSWGRPGARGRSPAHAPGRQRWLLVLVAGLAGLTGVARAFHDPELQHHDAQERDSFKLVFGSCHHQDKPTPVFETVAEQESGDADVMVFLGDSLYNDVFLCEPFQADGTKCGPRRVLKSIMQRLKMWGSMLWARLLARPDRYLPRHLAALYPVLKAKIQPVLTAFADKTVLAVWDDHDYGQNDAGAELWFKEESKQLFLDFWRPGTESEEGRGVQESHEFGTGDRKVHILLLDTRFHRSELALENTTGVLRQGIEALVPRIIPHHIDHDHTTILGEEQWAWLERELAKPGFALKLVVSPTQVLTAWNGQEAWVNFPSEQRRLMEVMHRTKAERVMFVSGDVHYGELSVWKRGEAVEGMHPAPYDLFDLTSSGFTEVWPNIYDNKFRALGSGILERNYGTLVVDWPTQLVTLQLHNETGSVLFEQEVDLTSLTYDSVAAAAEPAAEATPAEATPPVAADAGEL